MAEREPDHQFEPYDANPGICRHCGAVKPAPCGKTDGAGVIWPRLNNDDRSQREQIADRIYEGFDRDALDRLAAAARETATMTPGRVAERMVAMMNEEERAAFRDALEKVER